MPRLRSFAALGLAALVAAGCSDDDDAVPIPLSASAGVNASTPSLFFVRLDGSGSSGPPTAMLEYEWLQTAGPEVTLQGADSVLATFVAPFVTSSTTLTFELTVRNPANSTTDVDSVDVTVEPSVDAAATEFLGSTPVNGGGAARAEISAYHVASRRLFVVNAAEDRVEVFDYTSPAAPVFVDTIEVVPTFSGTLLGGPNSVAVSGDVLAVAIEQDPKQEPGGVQFFDVNTLAFLKQVLTGALPDMVTFTPDGTSCLVANEGEPDDDYVIDPEGSVTIIRIPAGGPALIDPLVHVAQVDFHAFDGLEGQLRAQGVRIFGPNASASQDLEPEYVAVSADSTTAYVTLQENNAVAEIDVASATVTGLASFGAKSWASPAQLHRAAPALYRLPQLELLGTTPGGDDARLGGFSGLDLESVDPDTGVLGFVTVVDRGPHLDAVDVDGDGVDERPFALPDYQARIVAFTLDPTTGAFEVTSQLALTAQDGVTPISGLPNLLATSPGLAFHDEEPVDVFGAGLRLDALGGDLEGIVAMDDGTYWLCDEYRPSLYHFGADGALIERLVPAGSNGFGVVVGTEALPAAYAQRALGQGFGALAWDANRERLYAFMQAPLDNPDTADDSGSAASRIVRVLEVDPEAGAVTGEYVYARDDANAVGGATWSGATGQFLVTEHDDAVGTGAIKDLYRVSISGATNLQALSPAAYDLVAGPGGLLESTAPDQLGALGVRAVDKRAFASLGTEGYVQYDEPSGLARLPDGRLALLNDEDFGLSGADLDTSTGAITPDPSVVPEVTLALVTPLEPGIDASDRDDGVAIRAWPVHGLYLPDAIVAFEVDGRTYLATANEGDARDYAGFDEEARVASVRLDPGDFPDAAALQLEENLGRLKVTTAGGDADGDALTDELLAFGGRSFAIWSTQGELVYDSGSLLERLTLSIDPERFNSDGDSASFDTRSDDKGVEPEGIAFGEISGRPHLFVGLERFGGVMVFDASNPTNPRFVTYLDPATDVAPEGLVFVPAASSPNGRPLLFVSYEGTGTVGAYALDF